SLHCAVIERLETNGRWGRTGGVRVASHPVEVSDRAGNILCPGSGAVGGHDRPSSRSGRAGPSPDRSRKAPRRQSSSPVPCGSWKTRIAAARRRASMFADYPRRGPASPLQLSCPQGREHPPRTGSPHGGPEGSLVLFPEVPMLDHFIRAQDPIYATVLAELRAGAKASHWM